MATTTTASQNEWLREFSLARVMDQFEKGKTIEGRDLAAVLRALWQNPTADDLRQRIDAVDRDGTGRLDYVQFLTLISQWAYNVDAEDDVRGAFRLLVDERTRRVRVADFIRLVKGDGLSEENVRALLGEAGIDSTDHGTMTFTDFVRLMVGFQK